MKKCPVFVEGFVWKMCVDCWFNIEDFFFCYSIYFEFFSCGLFLFLVFALFYLLRVACNVHLNLIWNHFNFIQVMMAFPSSPFKYDAIPFNENDATKRAEELYLLLYEIRRSWLFIAMGIKKKKLCFLSPPYSSPSSHTLCCPSWKKNQNLIWHVMATKIHV